jgi:hypothetical protein
MTLKYLPGRSCNCGIKNTFKILLHFRTACISQKSGSENLSMSCHDPLLLKLQVPVQNRLVWGWIWTKLHMRMKLGCLLQPNRLHQQCDTRRSMETTYHKKIEYKLWMMTLVHICKLMWHSILQSHDKWNPVTTAWHILGLRTEEWPPIWRVAMNIPN